MMQEKTFLARFKANLKAQVKKGADLKEVHKNLFFGRCPFPDVCSSAYDECKRGGACPGDYEYTRTPKSCPISPRWQQQVAYFHPRRRNLELIDKMMKIVEEMRGGEKGCQK